MAKEIRNCIAVVEAHFCECGGAMTPDTGGAYMSSPPKRKIECKFCGSTRVVLDRDSGLTFNFMDEAKATRRE